MDTWPKAVGPRPYPHPVYVLGAGNVGLGLTMALEARGVPVMGLWNRSRQRAAVAAEHVRCPVVSGTLPTDLTAADVVLLTVSDRAIAEVSDSLAHTRLKARAVLAHTSGFLPAAAKPHYHAAAALASNCVVALLKLACDEAAAAGVENLEGPLTQLALGAIEKTARLGVAAALTGPALRGDADTVLGHGAALGSLACEAYKPLTVVALAIAQQRGLSDATANAIEASMMETNAQKKLTSAS